MNLKTARAWASGAVGESGAGARARLEGGAQELQLGRLADRAQVVALDDVPARGGDCGSAARAAPCTFGTPASVSAG